MLQISQNPNARAPHSGVAGTSSEYVRMLAVVQKFLWESVCVADQLTVRGLSTIERLTAACPDQRAEVP